MASNWRQHHEIEESENESDEVSVEEDVEKQEENHVPCECCKILFHSNAILNHIGHNKKCKTFYGIRFDEMKKEKKRERAREKKRRQRMRNGIEKELLKQRESYASNPTKRMKKQGASTKRYQENREELSKEYRDKAREAKKDSTANQLKYEEAIKYGPIFICVCCHCTLFKENVKIFSDSLQEKIRPDVLDDSCIFDKNFKDPLGKSNHYVCHNCFKVMKTDNKVPSLSIKNGPYVEEIPPELQLTPLENQCIARNVLFMKIKELPKTRMKGMVDRTVLVPIEDTEVMNTMQTLPRSLDDSAVVGVDFKRMKNMKNVHVTGYLRPTKMYQALVTLKVLGNPHYQTIIKKCLYCSKVFAEDDKNMLEHVKQCLLKSQVESEDPSIEIAEGIKKDNLKPLLKPKIMELLEEMKSRVLEEIKPFTSGQDMSDLHDSPLVIDDDLGSLHFIGTVLLSNIDETTDEKEVIDYHFQKSKDPSSPKSPKQMIEILGSIKSMEFWTKIQVMIPIFEKTYQLIKSKCAFEKVFQYEFEKTKDSILTVNYEDVLDEARDDAFEEIYPSIYKKAIDSVFESPVYDSVYDESYKLALESCPSGADGTEFEELFDSIYEPLLDQKVDLALESEIESAQNTPKYEEIFRRCVHSIFESNLQSTMESTYKKMIDSMFYEELEKMHQAYMDTMDSL